MPKIAQIFSAAAAVIAAALSAPGAAAQSAAEFYRNRQINMVVGSDAGGGFDLYARLLSRHMGRHLPEGARFVVQNMPGAGSVTMSNALTNNMPKDGAFIGAPQSSMIVERLLHLVSPGGKAANFDVARLNWLGTMTQDVFAVFGWHGKPIQGVDGLRKATYSMGVSGPNTDGYLIGSIMNTLLGTKIKIITGYKGPAEELIAMERGEIDVAPMAFSAAITLRPTLLEDKKFPIMLQMGARLHPELPDVPSLYSLVSSADDRAALALIFDKYQLGRPYFVAADVPAERVAMLRKAFDAALADKELRAEAAKLKAEIDPLDGASVQGLIEKMYAQPEALVKRARMFLGKDS